MQITHAKAPNAVLTYKIVYQKGGKKRDRERHDIAKCLAQICMLKLYERWKLAQILMGP